MIVPPKDHMVSLEYIQNAIFNPLKDQKCPDLHGGSCNIKMLQQFVAGCSSLYKMYLIIHLIPFVIFKRQKLIKNPKKQIKHLIVAFIKSLLFAGGYSAIVKRMVCFFIKYFQCDYGYEWIASVIAGVTLNFESPSRQCQIALFCMNKTLETSYNLILRRNSSIRIPYGEIFLMGIATSILSYHYLNHRQSIRPNYLSILDTLLSGC